MKSIAAIANNSIPMTNTQSDQSKAFLFILIALSCDSAMTRSALIASTCICRASLALITFICLTGEAAIILLALIDIYADYPVDKATQRNAAMMNHLTVSPLVNKVGTIIARTTPEIAIIAFD